MCGPILINCPPTCIFWSLRPIDFHSELIASLGAFVESENYCRQVRHEMEAKVGIGRLMPCFQGKTTPLSEQVQYNLALFELTHFNPLTEGFYDHFGISISK